MQRLLVLNLFISLLWPILNGDHSLRALLIGFILGFVLLSIVQRKYGYYTLKLFRFTAYVLYAILQSNLRLAAIVLANALRSTSSLRPGIVAVPLALTNPLDITVLASIITLTPGTLSVDLDENVHGHIWPYNGSDAATSQLSGAVADAPSDSDDELVEAKADGGALQHPKLLLVHTVHIVEPKAFRAEIKHNFERPILELRWLLEELDAADM